MGNFSRDTFDRLKHYVTVRLQQGVPIVDADWNELQDIRKYELQAFLKWFVGNGVPMGNDGFAIGAVATDNDFSIGQGRCLVEGWDVINEGLLNYTDQPLFGDTALADQWGVSPLEALTTPGAARADTVYLDVWEREVDSSEDPDVVNPDIGIETSVRTRREWIVRVAEGETSAPGAPPADHVFYEIATLRRSGGDAQITDIVDLRRTSLGIPSQNDVGQIVLDAFGSGYTVDSDGQPNLKVSLREAINAILRGGLPRTPDAPVLTGPAAQLVFALVRDSSGDLWIFYGSNEGASSTSLFNIWYRRYVVASDTWDAETQLTTSENISTAAIRAFEDQSGRIWVVWSADSMDVVFNRYNPTTDTWEGETPLTTDTNRDFRPAVTEDTAGRAWVFWESDRGGNYDIYYNRYDPATDTWLGDTPLTNNASSDRRVYALRHSNGDLWVFWESNRNGQPDIFYSRYDPAADTWSGDTALTTDAGKDERVYAIEDANGDIWAFWFSNRLGGDKKRHNEIFYGRYDQAADVWETDDVQLTSSEQVYFFHALVASDGDIWVFWSGGNSGSSSIWYKRKSADGGWEPAVQMTGGDETDRIPLAVEEQGGDIRVFWTRNNADLSSFDVYETSLIPAI